MGLRLQSFLRVVRVTGRAERKKYCVCWVHCLAGQIDSLVYGTHSDVLKTIIMPAACFRGLQIMLLQFFEDLSGCCSFLRINQAAAVIWGFLSGCRFVLRFPSDFNNVLAAAVFSGCIRLLQFSQNLSGCCNVLKNCQAADLSLGSIRLQQSSEKCFRQLQFSEDLSGCCSFLRNY